MLILIIEDNALLAFMIEEALEEAGYEVIGPASTPAHAVTLADRFRPDLALVDLDLKDHASGVEVARNLHRNFGIPSLFATGQLETARQHTDTALGVLCKPFAPETVVEAIEIVERLLAGEPFNAMPRELELFERRGSAK